MATYPQNLTDQQADDEQRDQRGRVSSSFFSAPGEGLGTSLLVWIIPLALLVLVIATLFLDRGGTFLGGRGAPGSDGIASAQAPGSGRRGPPQTAFDLSQATVPVNEIMAGGPPKDGIPALTNPRFIAAKDASYLSPGDRVIGLTHAQGARAYPLKILNFHEIVNDRIGDLPVVVTYCPLCDSAAAFDRRTPLGEREFGVSGLLYNSNVLMYDRGGRPESLWSQVKAEGVTGPAAGKSLRAVPVELTTWSDWRARNPQTTVLSPNTGHQRDYRVNPYGGYFQAPNLMFPARPMSDALPAKARVLGVWTPSTAHAYPLSAFGPQRRQVEDQIDGKKLTLDFDPRSESLRVVEADEGIQWMYTFWFAWYALRPETELFH